MKQYGDITKIHGYDIKPVDLIVGGSPCQDLSMAGLRKGLSGERSGLFMEMIRIIREMKDATDTIRYGLWENVPGSFSSNDGRDFSAVLGEFARLIEPDAPDVPMPQKGWPKSGVLLVSDGAIAWRTHDAQFWGVAQRRRRVSALVSFRDKSAYKILFESRRSQWDFEQGKKQKQKYPARTVGRVTKKSIGVDLYGQSITGDVAATVTAASGVSAGHSGPAILTKILNDQGGEVMNVSEEVTGTLRAESHGHEPIVFGIKHLDKFKNSFETVRTRYGTGGNNTPVVLNEETDIRRITPLEAERLQGYPDGWTDIPGATDAKRFKALGNSIALPFWQFLADRLVKMGGVKTIGSLFDGIGGFPLVFSRAGATPVWASEIEPFPMAVTAYRFGEEK